MRFVKGDLSFLQKRALLCYYSMLRMLDLARQKLLIIAPHPDDEVIGAGGLMAKIKRLGGKLYVLYLTVGDTLDFSKRGQSTMREREKEIERVAKFLKFDDYHIAFPGNDHHLRLDVLGQKNLMQVVERESSVSLQKVKPSIIAFPHLSSYNQDHRITAKAVHAALRPAPNGPKHLVDTVLSYEEAADTWTMENVPQPNCFVPLTEEEVKIKMHALGLYKTQFRNAPNLRSPEVLLALATLRGAQCGREKAEGFIAYRTII